MAMELVEHMDVTCEEFFDILEENVLADVENATGKRMNPDHLQGHRYSKKVASGRKGVEMKVKIKHFRRPAVYEARFSYNTGTNTIRYELAPAEDGGCDITYTEDFVSSTPEKGLMYKLARANYDRKLRSRAKQTLSAIEKTIKERRKNDKIAARKAEEAAQKQEAGAAEEP